ncbi:MAG: hypothetical protein RR417_03510 [Kiritimatiellia bacterium]
MVQILLTKYWVLAHLLMTVSTLCFFPAVSVGAMLWCATSLLLMMFCLPPVLKGESFVFARMRMRSDFQADALVYFSFMAILYVTIQILNGPRALEYAPELRRWLYAAPFLPLFPSHIQSAVGVPFFVGLLGGLTSAVVIRCSLMRKQRMFLLLGVGLSTAALGVVGGICVALGCPLRWEWMGGVSGISVLWMLMFCVCLGMVCEAFLEGRLKTFRVALIAACANELGLFACGSAVMMRVSVVVVIVYLIFMGVLVRGSGRFPRALWYSVTMLPMIFAAAIGIALVPSVNETSLVSVLNEGAKGAEAFWEQWIFRARLALDVFSSEPMMGTGPGGFEACATFFVKGKSAWALWRSGGTALPCDFLRLLCEQGMMGTLFLLLPGVAMLGRCLVEWMEIRQDRHRSYSFRYIFIFVGSWIGIVSVLIASIFGTPLHEPAVLCVFLIVCACLRGWMPRRRH